MATAAEADPNHRSIHVITPDQPGGAGGSPAVAPWVAAQRRLNHFVRTVAFLERAGNGLGTLAFTWATVVILGGFSTNLGPDFWYATAIVFLEAFRVFSRESRSDDELLFKTTGSIRLKRVRLISSVPYYLNVGIVMVSLYGTIEFLLIHYRYLPRPPHRMPYHFVLLAALLALASMVQLPTFVRHIMNNTLLQSSPLVAVLAFGGVLLWTNAPPRFAALVVAPLFVGCLQYSVIATCLNRTNILSRLDVRLQNLGSLVLPVWIAISVPIAFRAMGILVLLGTLLVGNIQIPMALARIGLSSMRLSGKESHTVHDDDNNEHLAPALKIFYSMVLSQGTLYMLACISESLLFLFIRRSLARALSDDKEGFRFVDLYYEHAYDKCMEDGILVQEDLNLVRFAVDSLSSNSRTQKLAAVQILHSLLQPQPQEAFKKLQASEIITSTKAVVALISMLGFRSEDQDIRLFAAKITAELARDLLIVGIPGTIQVISSLLDSEAKNYSVKQSISAQRVDTNEQHTDNCQLSHDSAARVDIKGEEAGYQTASERASSAHPTSKSKWSSKLCRYFQSIMDKLSVPKEGKEHRTDDDSFPVQGMIILKRLSHDLQNCAEISRATGLIPKIVDFITTDTTSISEEKENLIMTASLKLVARLASVEGEIGTALRRKILEQPFLLSNLVEILEGSNGRPEQWGAALVIIAKLAVDEETRQKIGDFQVIIPKLTQTFLCQNESLNTHCDRVVRMVAGEALSKLTKENTSYCSAFLEEKRYDVIEHLKNMLKEDEYAYVAASMLWNLCGQSKDKLLHLGSLHIRLMSTLRVVLAKVMDTKGNKQLEALLVLALQLYNLNPEQFAYEAESHTNARRLVEKLVGTLNSNQKSHPEYPRLRRAVIEVTISIVESCPRYSTIFREEGMMEALSKVEIALLMVEKYKAFLGNIGDIMESGLHLPDLLVKAKQIICSATPIPATELTR